MSIDHYGSQISQYVDKVMTLSGRNRRYSAAASIWLIFLHLNRMFRAHNLFSWSL